MRISINGYDTHVVDGASITVKDGTISIDGVVSGTFDGAPDITIYGDPGNIEADGNVKVVGIVAGSINAGGSINCDDVHGNASAGGSINCDDVHGNASAGGSINCDDVGGSVTAGGSGSCG